MAYINDEWVYVSTKNETKIKSLFLLVDNFDRQVLINKLEEKQDNADNIISENGEYFYKNIYIFKVLDKAGKLRMVIPSTMADKLGLYDYQGEYIQVLDTSSAINLNETNVSILTGNKEFQDRVVDDLSWYLNKKIDDKIQEIFNHDIAQNSEFLERLAIKVIEYMHINGVDFTYAPTLAKVSIVNGNSSPIEVGGYETTNGLKQYLINTYGRYTIQVSNDTEIENGI